MASSISHARTAVSGTATGVVDREVEDHENDRLPAARAEIARSIALALGSFSLAGGLVSGQGEPDRDEAAESIGVNRAGGVGGCEPNHRARLDALTGMIIKA